MLTSQEIIDQAVLLPPVQQLEFVEGLMHHLQSTGCGASSTVEWTEEMLRRVDSLRTGGSQGRSWEVVRTESRHRLATVHDR